MQTAYVDGSLKGKQGGWAFVIRGERNLEQGGRFDCDDSYLAELTAIYKTLELSQGDICIVTDHQAIANDFNRMLFNDQTTIPEKNKELWLKIKFEAEGRVVLAQWQKGYSSPEMRIAHKMANANAGAWRG